MHSFRQNLTPKREQQFALLFMVAVGMCLNHMQNVRVSMLSAILRSSNNMDTTVRGLMNDSSSSPIGISFWNTLKVADDANTAWSLIARFPPEPDLSIQEKLWNETGHSVFSPLSPHYKGLPSMDPNFARCAVTTQMQVQRNEEKGYWMLQTLDAAGQPKSIGGDEFYITFTKYQDANNTLIDQVTKEAIQVPTLVALPTDLENGSYRLDFFTPPLQTNNHKDVTMERSLESPQNLSNELGFLTTHFSYTCGMGLITKKSDWKSRGVLHWKHVSHDISMPPWQPFQPPSNTLKKRLSQYDYVAVFGDSIMGQFVGQYRGNPIFRKYTKSGFPSKGVLHFGDNIRRSYEPSKHKELKELFLEWHDKKLRQHNNTAILIGSGQWDLGAITWDGGDENFTIDPALEGYRTMIQWFRQEYPSSTILWKEQSAIHPHNVPKGSPQAQGNMYTSALRTRKLVDATRSILKELQVPILDIYNATALCAHCLYPGNSNHYIPEMNHRMIHWFW